MLEKVRGLLLAMNKIDVRGWDNMTAMVGCMRLLKDMEQELMMEEGVKNRAENE